ncbi:MAG TPA: LuxR C-terminal-related transcriptional regulator [Chloroflexota bacterium]|nr:LuxR C-terminal-related transcriptional regulator [Chloroflexota bacterium]
MGHNLPARLTSFIGREREIAEIGALLETQRLITLVGAPGVGKTRLSLQIAAGVLDEFPDGVWLVELAPLSDPLLVPQAAADVLGVREQQGRSLTATLAEQLRSRHLLLVLDNCEHLIGAAAELVEALVRGCPDLHVLATSREPLVIEGEAIRRVPSLTIPDLTNLPNGEHGSVMTLIDFEAVQLFVERARAADPAFALTERTAPVVAQICRRLDGIPLAIELAAARARALAVEQIAARLDDRFRLLTGGSRTALPRQQTLRGAVDWSYDLLNGPERTLLRRLAVFAGGFTLSAAEAVCDVGTRNEDRGARETSAASRAPTDGASPVVARLAAPADIPVASPLDPRPSILELLVSLVDKSLVQVDEAADGERRYRLLETFRQYGQEKLVEHGELAAARDRHRDYWLSVVEDAQPRLDGAGQLATLTYLDREHDNLRAALAWCLEAAASQPTEPGPDGHPPSRTPAEIGIQLAGALWRFWWLRGHIGEGLRWLNRVLELPWRADSAPSARSYRARALFGAGNLMQLQLEVHAAIQYLEIALSLSRAAGDDRGVSQALRSLGPARAYAGDHDLAHRLCEESVEIARRAGDPYTLAMALYGSSQVSRFLDEYDRTLVFCEEGLALLRALGDVVMSAYALRNLAGAVFHGLGDRARARALVEEALRLSRDLGDKRGQGDSLQHLGHYALRSGDFARAISMLRPAILILQESGERGLIVWSCFRLAQVRTEQGVRDQAGGQPLPSRARGYLLDATRLFSAIDAFRHQHRLGPLHNMDRELDRALPMLRHGLGEQEFAQAWAEGQTMTFEQIVTYALEITRDAAPAEPMQGAEAGAPPPDPHLAQLTPREREIAVLIARGRSNRQIAAELTLTRRTVETHVHNILGKLELTSRSQLAIWAIEHGLATPRSQ